MAKITPFPGIRFNPDRVGNLAHVISPPYDKISNPERKRLWNLDEHNVVKLILPPPSDSDTDVMTQSTDSESAEWYEEAAKRLREWQSQGILKNDEPSLYVYHQTYTYKNVTLTRSGLFVALQLEDNSGPHAHEHTFEGPKADRLRLTRAAQANLSPIFLLGGGEENGWRDLFARATTPLVDFTDHEGHKHQLWALTGEDNLAGAKQFLEDCDLVIADGHHRYETALNYRREMLEKTGKKPENEAWGYVLALVVPLISEGLRVLPTHRVLRKLPEGGLQTIRDAFSQGGQVYPIANPSGEAIRALLGQEENANAIVMHTPDETLLLRLKTDAQIPALESSQPGIRELNVTILHRFIFEDLLKLPADQLADHVRYIRGEEESIDMVSKGEGEAAFLMAGIPEQTVFEVSKKGLKMPQKSTDFYPKIPTGLLIRSAADSESS